MRQIGRFRLPGTGGCPESQGLSIVPRHSRRSGNPEPRLCTKTAMANKTRRVDSKAFSSPLSFVCQGHHEVAQRQPGGAGLLRRARVRLSPVILPPQRESSEPPEPGPDHRVSEPTRSAGLPAAGNDIGSRSTRRQHPRTPDHTEAWSRRSGRACGPSP